MSLIKDKKTLIFDFIPPNLESTYPELLSNLLQNLIYKS
jgi:hypothetical protein